MPDKIDLDALAPQAVTVTLNKKDFEIPPPSLQDVMRLGSLSQKLSKFDSEDLESASALINDLTEQVYRCAPALQGETLNTAQILQLVRIITEMSVPEDSKELQDRGITPGGGDGSPKA